MLAMTYKTAASLNKSKSSNLHNVCELPHGLRVRNIAARRGLAHCQLYSSLSHGVPRADDRRVVSRTPQRSVALTEGIACGRNLE